MSPIIPKLQFEAAKQSLRDALDNGVRYATRLAVRALAHLGAILISVAVALTFDPQSSGLHSYGTFGVFFSSYLGLICMLPGRISNHFLWLAPGITGLAMAICWGIMGVPWHLLLLWAGVQALLLRGLLRTFNSVWELVVPLPLATVFVIFFLDNYSKQAVFSVPFYLFPVFTLAGGLVMLVYKKRRQALAQGRLIVEELGLLTAYLERQDKLPPDLYKELEIFKERAQKVPVAAWQGKKASFMLPALPDINRELYARIPFEADEEHVDYALLLQNLRPLNSRLQEMLATIRVQAAPLPKVGRVQNESDSLDIEKRLASLNAQAEALLQKKDRLPESMHTQVNGLHKTARNIMQCMREDALDVEPGDRFLKRYLPLIHRVIDEYIRLSKGGAPSREVEGVLERCGVILTRMQGAFIHEHARLMRNDVIGLHADLDVLDSLLKQQGS